MKKSFLLSIFAVAALASCQKDADIAVGGQTVEATFEATILTDATRTTADVGNNAVSVFWAKDDAIWISPKGGEATSLTIDEDGVGKTSGTFTGTITEGEGTNYIAYYPYVENGISLEGTTLSVNLPAEQKYVEGSLASAPMLAVSQTKSLEFKNLAALVRIVLTGDNTKKITKVTLRGNGGETLAGKATVDVSAGTLALKQDAEETTLTLDCGNGIALSTEGTEFYFVVPAMTLASGFTIVATSADDEVMTKSTNNSVELEANKVYNYEAVAFVANATVVSQQDFVTKLQNAESGDIFVFSDDITTTAINIDSGKKFSFDLNGKTWNLGSDLVRSSETEYGLKNNGELTITNGTITSSASIAAIYNSGTLTITNSTINADQRGVINNGTLTLNCNITSKESNAICGYGDSTNIITIDGGTYTASKTTPNTAALRMDPRLSGDKNANQVDRAWQLTINGGTFVSENWVALEMLNNYYGLNDPTDATINASDANEGWAKIKAGTFTGSADYADIGGTAVENIYINTEKCILTNQIIKNQTTEGKTIKYNCIMNGYNLQDRENHYNEVWSAEAALKDVVANGGTYTLTKDVTLAETLTVTADAEKKVNLNLGDFTLISTNDVAAIINNGVLTLTSSSTGGVKAYRRGVVNNGTLTLDCYITSDTSNAVCGYGENNIITINGGKYTASTTTEKTTALRMDPYTNCEFTNSKAATDSAWQLTINGGTFISEKWVALEMLDNYYGLNDPTGATKNESDANEGWAKINAGTFTGSADYADIGGTAVENITINTDNCTLTNQIIKNQTTEGKTIKYNCIMNGYNLQDRENHYSDVKDAWDDMKSE